MPVNTDVMQIVQILEEEGFGALAGELLMEINLGREPNVDDGDGAETMKSETSAEDDFDPHGRPSREPIPDDEQLSEAVRFLRLRLVEPVRHLAEAERIAEELVREQNPDGTPQTPRTGTKILFVNPLGDTVAGFVRTESAGEVKSADEIDKILARIVEQVA